MTMASTYLQFALAQLLAYWCAIGAPPDPTWSPEATHRMLVRVPPAKLGDRDHDEMVARCPIDIAKNFPVIPGDRSIDLSTLQVMKYSFATGEFEEYANHYYGRSRHDRPFRFYDKSLLDEFPTWRRYASIEAQRGRPLVSSETIPFGHRLFNAVGDGVRGSLVWSHTQQGQRPSYYAIAFRLLTERATTKSPPAGFVGDGGNRIVKESAQCGPPGNNAGCTADWNGDGLYDVVYGTSSGYLIVAENTGTRDEPRFERRQILYDATGRPIDVGFDSYPHVTDWNQDGKKDLLVGAEKGCIFYYENSGTDDEPRLTQVGIIRADNEMLLTPNWPIAELAGKPRGSVFKSDYVAIPFAVDWDGDGDLDLLAGGFVTGMVYLFENVRKQGDQIDSLEHRGPLLADGKPIDTQWAAAPVAVDIDDDGDLDLICGAKAMTPAAGDASDAEKNLFYFENVGSRRRPLLSQRPFPMNAVPPTGKTLMPSVVDWDQDGLLDLVLVARSTMQTFFVRNVGSKKKPHFDMNVKPLVGYWTNAALSTGSFIDWNHDGFPDQISRFSVLLNSGKGMPGFFERRVNLLAGAEPIRHSSPYGDENPSIVCFDFDRDGDYDCLYGAHSGHVWYHENRGTVDQPHWDTKGYRLPLDTGGVLKVGLPEGTTPKTFDFVVLQGARAKPAPEDFNGDGRTDLVVADTYGKVRYYENVGTNSTPRFADPVVILERPNRLNVTAVKWNADPHPDVIVILGNGVYVLENKGIQHACEFKEGQALKLPRAVGNLTSVSLVDYNQDGDVDVLYNTSHRMTCFVESSFSMHGYRDAQVIAVETRQPPAE